MKGKKLLSTAVAGLLVAAQMVMPVMAADGGKVDVDIDTTSVVIRVKVPTSLVVSVNQFEKGDAGSQITSDDFTIENLSEIPVWVTVDSKLTMANTVVLKEKRDDAKKSTVEAGEAWIGVAAQTATTATGTSADYAETSKTFADLNESSENVTTFVQAADKASATAKQEFYLAKTGTSNVTYKSFIPKEDAKADETYARFYLLTAITQGDSDDLKTAVEKVIKTGDVYSVATADDNKSGKVVTLIKKGDETTAVDTDNNVYYTAAATVTAEAQLKTDKFYVYAEDAAGGKTAFRYIGSLSDSKATWTKDDFSKMEIKYDIKGLTDTKYKAAVDADSLINGYKKPVPAGPSVTFSSAGEIKVTNLASDQTVTKIEIAYTKDGEQLTEDITSNQNVTWNSDKTAGTMNSNWTDYLDGCGTVTVTVSISGNVTKTATATF